MSAEDRVAKAEAALAEALEVVRPFAVFADPYRHFPAAAPITNGSPMAKRQLTMSDCYAAADFLAKYGASGDALKATHEREKQSPPEVVDWLRLWWSWYR